MWFFWIHWLHILLVMLIGMWELITISEVWWVVNKTNTFRHLIIKCKNVIVCSQNFRNIQYCWNTWNILLTLCTLVTLLKWAVVFRIGYFTIILYRQIIAYSICQLLNLIVSLDKLLGTKCVLFHCLKVWANSVRKGKKAFMISFKLFWFK